MSTEFKREERYIVFKLKDMSLNDIHFLREWSAHRPIPTIECVVVESDWPEYEEVWRMIEARMTGATLPKCTTCNGHGRIGGSSYYAPDEGGEPCPDCNQPSPNRQGRED